MKIKLALVIVLLLIAVALLLIGGYRYNKIKQQLKTAGLEPANLVEFEFCGHPWLWEVVTGDGSVFFVRQPTEDEIKKDKTAANIQKQITELQSMIFPHIAVVHTTPENYSCTNVAV